jgi:serralysin
MASAIGGGQNLPAYGDVIFTATDFRSAENMDAINFKSLTGMPVADRTATDFRLYGGDPAHALALRGEGFTYDANGQLTGGTLHFLSYSDGVVWLTADLDIPAAPVMGLVLGGDATAAFSYLLSGLNHVRATDRNDLLRGYGDSDNIEGGAGADTIYGGTGDDFIAGEWQPGSGGGGTPGGNYLRGDEGNDSIYGGSAFDDINGNVGNDTCYGGDGDDWVVGGKDNDVLYGDLGPGLPFAPSTIDAAKGFDIVYGNMGDDTCYGQGGADWVRGGQGNDSVSGGDGDDWLWGDRGDDTISGGAGADIFHSFSGAGIDRITDFNAAEGDKIQLDPGSAYTVKQVGADTIVDMGNGDLVILVGVQLSSLSGPWVFVS